MKCNGLLTCLYKHFPEFSSRLCEDKRSGLSHDTKTNLQEFSPAKIGVLPPH